MRKLCCAAFVVLFLLVGCSRSTRTQDNTQIEKEMSWQDYYDLGIRYLSEGSYQEAIIAFTAAIEIDAKRTPAYIGRGDAYIGMASVLDPASQPEGYSEAMNNAVNDYATAIGLDPSASEVYRKLADAYIALGDVASAQNILKKGYAATDDQRLKEYFDTLMDNEAQSNSALNAYGGTEFTARDDYRVFSDFSSAEQDYIREMVNAAILQDTDTMQKMLGFRFEPYDHRKYWSGYTMVDGYKIRLYTAGEQVEENGNRYASVHMEIRQENGDGYWYNVSRRLTSDYDSFDYTQTICPCQNWQWNGSYEETYHFIQIFDDKTTVENTDITTGQMENSLRVGIFYSEGQEIWSKWTDSNYNYTTTTVYENGVQVEYNYTSYRNGTIIHSRNDAVENAGPTKMDGSCGGTIKDQWVLDELYW